MFFQTTPALKSIELPDRQFLLRAPLPRDFTGWKQLREESREFLEPWEPVWPSDDLTRIGYRRRLRRYAWEREQKTGETYFLVRVEDEQIMGGISISNIRYGVARSCNIGYWMGEKFAAQGFMKMCVRAITDHIFDNLQLHRIEAACLPHNQQSSNLLEKAGFVCEGLVREYLEINGIRQDHLLFSFIKADRENSDLNLELLDKSQNSH